MKEDKKKILNLPIKERLILLEALGYSVDLENYIIKKETGERVEDKYTGSIIKLENASVLPGSTIVIDTNSFSLSEYLEEYPINVL